MPNPVAASDHSLKRLLLRSLRHCLVIYLLVCLAMFLCQRMLLFIPSHDRPVSRLETWKEQGRTIGYCREVENPRNVWFMMHGNAGQASDRDYVLSRMSPNDALYVLEYPGYGDRPGKPCKAEFDRAAAEAYRSLCKRYPETPVCVLGESIGGGPACMLAEEDRPPAKIVLVTPFDSLANVAANRFYFLPVRLLLLDRWDNAAALKNYRGALEIYGARDDLVIPISHARNLADCAPGAKFTAIPGGHNEWSYDVNLMIEN